MKPTNPAAPYAWLIHAARSAIAAVMASALLAAPVVAASFDCGKARTTVERLICSNPIVSALDDSLALAYTQALELASDADELRRQQRDWLSKRRNICTTIECLLHVYGRRLEDIEDLNRWIPVPPLATTPLTAAENAACQNVVDYANNSNLRDLRVQTNYPLPNALEFDEIFGSSLGIYDFNSYWSIDIDDDGTLDHMLVAIRDGMSAIAVARRNVKGAKTEIVDDFERGNDMISVLQIASRYYVLSERYDYGLLPGSLWMWRTGGNLERLCDFEEIDPAITLMPNSIHPVCKADQANKTVGIEYPHAHSIDALPRDIFTDVFAKPGMARADLDNDGQVESIVRIDGSSYSGRGPGCHSNYLAIVSDDGTEILDTPLSKLLIDHLANAKCGKRFNVLEYGGTAYLESHDFEGDRRIYQLDSTKATLLCEYKYQRVFRASPAYRQLPN